MILSVGVNSCVTNPATGESEFSLLSQAQEKELGTQGDVEIVAQYGVYEDAAVSQYVDGLGQALAAKSESPSLGWTFRVLDSPVINAFALPGGFVYVTRGLLAHIENEAQLAVVIGHEIGHVTARHTARRYTSAQLAGLGLGLGGILFEDARPYLGAVETGLSLLFLKYSRDDENQADELGVRYATRGGYMASEGSKFFHTLKRLSDQQQGGALPTWASTHPDPVDREQHVLNVAAENAALFPGVVLGGTSVEAFVPRFNNIVFGQNPRQGFVQGGVFYHPDLRIQFSVPTGWNVFNSPSQVQMAPNTQTVEAAIVMQATSGTSPSAVASSFISANKATVIENVPTTVNGFTAQRVKTNITLDDGSVLTALSYFIQKESLIYIFHGYSAQAKFNTYSATFENVFTSFRAVTDAAVLAVQPYRLDVFSAPRTDIFSALVQANAAAGVTVTDLAIMNQREVAETVTSGASLKQVK
jgi:predicted Zn-dependent protease